MGGHGIVPKIKREWERRLRMEIRVGRRNGFKSEGEKGIVEIEAVYVTEWIQEEEEIKCKFMKHSNVEKKRGTCMDLRSGGGGGWWGEDGMIVQLSFFQDNSGQVKKITI